MKKKKEKKRKENALVKWKTKNSIEEYNRKHKNVQCHIKNIFLIHGSSLFFFKHRTQMHQCCHEYKNISSLSLSIYLSLKEANFKDSFFFSFFPATAL